MITGAFRHFRGVGPVRLQQLQDCGVRTWHDLLERGIFGFSEVEYQDTDLHRDVIQLCGVRVRRRGPAPGAAGRAPSGYRARPQP